VSCVVGAVLVFGLSSTSAFGAIVVKRVVPASVHPGGTARVYVEGYLGARPWPSMPLVIVPVGDAPQPSICADGSVCGPLALPSALSAAPFVLLGSIRRWHVVRYGGGGAGSLLFKVPSVAPGAYNVLLFCDRCVPGPSGSLISGPNVKLTITERPAQP
jgi:hypothetical protein